MAPKFTVAQRVLYLITAIVPVTLAGALGAWTTIPNVPHWYAGLAKPPFTPPNWVFGPAWTVLYMLMAIAFYRILSLTSKNQLRKKGLILFGGQLVLNTLWSFAFFGAHNPSLGLMIIIPLEVFIALMILCFYELDHLAGISQLPYLCWVGFAIWLNLGVFWLN